MYLSDSSNSFEYIEQFEWFRNDRIVRMVMKLSSSSRVHRTTGLFDSVHHYTESRTFYGTLPEDHYPIKMGKWNGGKFHDSVNPADRKCILYGR